MQRVKQFLIVLVAIVAIGLGNIACTTAPWGAPATAPPPSEAERIRDLEKDAAFTKGYRKGQRDARCLKNCGGGERRRPAKAKPAETAPPAPVPPVPPVPLAVAPPAAPKVPEPVKPVTMSGNYLKIDASGEAASILARKLTGEQASQITSQTVVAPCCPPTPPPAEKLPTRYTFPEPPVRPAPNIAPFDVPSADYYQQWPQPSTRWQSPPAKRATPPQATQPEKDGCGGRRCYR